MMKPEDRFDEWKRHEDVEFVKKGISIVNGGIKWFHPDFVHPTVKYT